MNPMRSVRRLPPRLAFWALAGVALLVSHDATWLAQVGPAESVTSTLRNGGHAYWGTATVVLTAVGVAAALAAAIRLYRLRRRTPGGDHAPARLEARPYLRRAGSAWLWLFGVVAIGFVVQENLEHALTHGHGLWVGALLGPEYPLALPVIAAVTLLGALVAAAFVTAERILLARLDSARPKLRAPRSVLRPERQILLDGGVGRRAHSGRGPPSLLVPV